LFWKKLAQMSYRQRFMNTLYNWAYYLKLPVIFWILMSGFALSLFGLTTYIVNEKESQISQEAKISTIGLATFVADYVEKNKLLIKAITFHHQDRILKLSNGGGYPYDLAEIQDDIGLLFPPETEFAVLNRDGKVIVSGHHPVNETSQSQIKHLMANTPSFTTQLRAHQSENGDFHFDILAPVLVADKLAGLWVKHSFSSLAKLISDINIHEYDLVLTESREPFKIIIGNKNIQNTELKGWEKFFYIFSPISEKQTVLAFAAVEGFDWQARAIVNDSVINLFVQKVRAAALLAFLMLFLVFASVFMFVRHLQEDREKLKRDSAYDELFNAGPTVLLEKNIDMRMSILYASPNAKKLLGKKSRELFKKSYLDWIHKDDASSVRKKLLDAYKKRLPSVELIYRLLDFDGKSYKWIYDLSHIVYNKADRPELLRGYITSIHAQKTAEKNATDLIQSVPEAIFIVNLSGCVVDTNQQAESLLGLKKDKIKNGLFTDYLEPTTLHEYEDMRRCFLKDEESLRGGAFPSGSLIMFNNRGQKVPVEISFNQIELNREILLIQVVRDVTIQAQTQNQMRLAKEQAEALAKARSRFVASISHEIRTPMNGVLGMTDLLSDTPLNITQHKYLQAIKQSGEVLLNIINEVLDFAKLDEGQVVLSKKPFSLTGLIDETMHIVSSLAEEKGIALEIDSSQLLHDEFVGDRVRLQQILLNLLGNALKFTEQGFVSIKVSETAVERDSDSSMASAELMVQVKDTGIGVAEENQIRLFESFTQAEENTSKKFGGTGLGLAICKQLVELMHGNIGVNSSKGQGSEFWIKIPLPVNENTLKPLPTKHEAQLAKSPLPLAGKTVLLIEDNEINQNVIVAFLERLGAKVDVAENGLKGVDIWRIYGHSYSLVLMDCQMPVMDGFEATNIIRREESMGHFEHPISIVALTANVMPEDRDKCLQSGMDDFIAKPIEREAFNSIVVKWCR
jgi:PAS domain S-box-containing protein